MLLTLTACTAPFRPTVPATPAAPATLIACDEMTPVPDRGSILPAFTPSDPCQLENVSNQVDYCLVHASPELQYPCSRTESVHEIALGEGGATLLIQRDYHVSTGCWHGITSDVRSLRVCDRGSGESTSLAQDVIGDPVLSPDGAWSAFVAAEPGSHRLSPHIFRVRLNGTDLVQLGTRPFPQDQVVGAQILQWSEDGEWLEVSLWDGREGSNHRYRIRPDGSGEFEMLP